MGNTQIRKNKMFQSGDQMKGILKRKELLKRRDGNIKWSGMKIS